LVTTDGRNFAFVFDKHTTGGKGLPRAMGADIVGTFIALVYLTPFIGGLIADRYLGYIRSIFLGGSLMAAGYLLLGIT
jgi:POT family proton-dependent oligopeptide transporter